MNIVDSSGWLEYFSDGPNAPFFASALRSARDLVVPTVSLYEVFKRVLQQRGEDAGLQAVALMQHDTLVADLTPTLALAAARLSLEIGMPMADSIMLATAQVYRAVLWTQDADFEDIPGVKFIKKKKGA